MYPNQWTSENIHSVKKPFIFIEIQNFMDWDAFWVSYQNKFIIWWTSVMSPGTIQRSITLKIKLCSKFTSTVEVYCSPAMWKQTTSDYLEEGRWGDRKKGVEFPDQFFLKTSCTTSYKTNAWALVSEAQWIECWCTNQKVTGLIPSQSTCLGCGPGPQ